MNSCCYKLKNKDKSTERFPPLLSKPTYIFAHAMPRAKNGKQKIPIVMKTRGLCPSISDYSMLATVVTTIPAWPSRWCRPAPCRRGQPTGTPGPGREAAGGQHYLPHTHLTVTRTKTEYFHDNNNYNNYNLNILTHVQYVPLGCQ